ncbi:SprT-like domain-containing protein [Nocardioides panaciterrulae]|uniref:Putative SprT family Zn-dependent metalloprotease n=1 Tax=Nocardioides panaciterrulae TaxID=661492 RepID=A0A7Y9JDE2_9ACTN|nr:SprT-like domain-containing protein [Nocardioides panaciterrulae]NYD43179.1 putative SprT family Zn-dependent metalloprotease [Nocardioides panaciterrulae]
MDLTEAATMGRRLLDEHGLGDWTLVFDRAKRRAGVCRAGVRQIGLSAPLTRLHPVAEVRDTLLHEIAHALVGPSHGHDQAWRAVARRIGCTGERCVSADVPALEGDWVGTCPAGHRVTRHRRPQRPASCRDCAPRFDLAHLLSWTFRGTPAPMLTSYDQALARLREPSPAGAGALPGVPLRIGDRVRIVSPGRKYDGVAGTLVKRGRTRYHLQVGRAVMTVPFTMVERA